MRCTKKRFSRFLFRNLAENTSKKVGDLPPVVTWAHCGLSNLLIGAISTLGQALHGGMRLEA